MVFRLVATCRLALAGLLVALPAGTVPAQEFRGLWVDAFHAGFRSSGEVSQLIADARAANCNAVVVEVRKRGDAYYNSNYEPKAADISPASFDPLADLVAKAHNTNNGPRLEVHAWIVTFPIWNNTNITSAPTNHPVRLHPDWRSETDTGATWSGNNYLFDPGHPGVQQHTFNVAMDIITRYDVDGLNFDYVRYLGNDWGYNPVAVARFNEAFARSGPPARTDPGWLQWRRDQVSARVRTGYLSAIAIKPRLKISADTICFAPGVTTDVGWTNSAAAYTSVLQDWRAWMEEGILDLNIPMAYFDQGGQYAYAWTNWNTFIKDHRYGRHAAIGPGIYLNSLSNALFQMRYTRRPSPAGNYADGVCGYSYAVPFDPAENPGLTRADFIYALTHPGVFDPNPIPLFPASVNPPVMPWKITPTLGHLKGFVFNATNGAGLEGATVSLGGPTARTLTADATGFFGAADLPPGEYTLSADVEGLVPQQTNVAIVAGGVATRDFRLAPAPPALVFNIEVTPGELNAIIDWQSAWPASSQVEFGLTTNLGTVTALSLALVTNHSVLAGGLTPDATYFFRVISRSGTNLWRSDLLSFNTAGPIIIDNTNAAFAGSWTVGTLSADKFGPDYRYATAVNGAATAGAVFAPAITTRGNYDVYLWYPQGSNRSTNTPYLVVYQGGQATGTINQTVAGGGWRLIGSDLNFAPGTNGYVRLTNNTGESNKVVMADAVRFVFVQGQDLPAPGGVPAWWAAYYFGTNVNAALDHDGDGYPTWMEYALGTDPTNAASHLKLTLERAAEFEAGFAPWQAGRHYELQRRQAPGVWQGQTNLPLTVAPDGRAAFAITNPPPTQSIYRMKVDLAR